MTQSPIIDAHIHLWPASAANTTSHAWMKPGDHLAKQYSIDTYLQATASKAQVVDLTGFVYVETDRTIVHDYGKDIKVWAAEPLKEISFLRGVVEGTANKESGVNASHATLLKGIVAWAPLDRPLHDFLQYITIAKEVAGEQTWNKIKGFRFLLQGIKDEALFKALLDTSTSSFIMLLKFLGTHNFSFDVGVDQRQGGVWQLEYFAEALEQTHKEVQPQEQTIFVLNHLCKPNMEQAPDQDEHTIEDFERWKSAISRMAKQDRVYMKLSGAFSELIDQDAQNPTEVDVIVDCMLPWIDHIFSEFGSQRIMFGSDWPVCNVRGPGDDKAWALWVQVVDRIMRVKGLSDLEMSRIWHGTAAEAYRLDV